MVCNWHLAQIEQEELFTSVTNEWLDRVEYHNSLK
ncbi:hypothetical protein LCGC14_1384280 [marine sediment metagenome]|uniref:Uncharacterized protein n=1 Tax=marine sediment metagenome TaxID=412755 RepID=A0A0F9K1T1_9ZZZZ